MRKTAGVLLTAIVLLLWAAPGAAAQWVALGPEGGDVRSLAFDPHNPDRILLGTSAGQLFLSTNAGRSWSRFARLGDGNHYVLDNIVFDPSRPGTIFVAAWSIETNGGDLFRSRDGGRTWQALPPMKGKSIRALEVAESNSKIVVVGALDGVFRSRDGGDTWELISPPNHAEIKTIESVAVDPRNPDVIYAGTWHLAWKTNDGGKNWHSIKKGMIDDSDVFSIIVDRQNSSVVYASACSGIYRSETAGELFRKVQGIPFSARRTRVLQQDPNNPAMVYAGTTEGLWRTEDAGTTWKRITEANRIVNDVLVDPRNSQRVLIATDRSGVLASSDGGRSFVSSNRGFAHRQVAAVLVDHKDPGTIYAGVINDKEFGGVFVSHDGGANWRQMSAGLGGRDVFSLAQSQKGALLAGTNRGMFMLSPGDAVWRPINSVHREKTKRVRAAKGKKWITRSEWVKSELNAYVWKLDVGDGKWLAATSTGLLFSLDEGRSWRAVPNLSGNFVAVHRTGEKAVAAGIRTAVVSTDSGTSWKAAALPNFISTISAAAIARDGSVWLATREGAWRSTNDGATWEHVLGGLPSRHVSSLGHDRQRGRLMAIATSGELFESGDLGKSWHRVPTGFALRLLFAHAGRYLGATAFDGVVAPPRAEMAARADAASGIGDAQPSE
jgi:photosystem II stability/assembly factor-like uncharacterized protein